MEKIVTTEKKMLAYVTQHQETPEAEAFREMLRFWEIYDAVSNTNHAEIIKIVYSEAAIAQTNVAKYLKANVSENTLIRYRKMYLDSYNACLNTAKNKRTD